MKKIFLIPSLFAVHSFVFAQEASTSLTEATTTPTVVTTETKEVQPQQSSSGVWSWVIKPVGKMVVSAIGLRYLWGHFFIRVPDHTTAFEDFKCVINQNCELLGSLGSDSVGIRQPEAANTLYYRNRTEFAAAVTFLAFHFSFWNFMSFVGDKALNGYNLTKEKISNLRAERKAQKETSDTMPQAQEEISETVSAA